MYDAIDISEYVLWYCESELEKPITNLQLQKFLYYIQGANLVANNKPLFENPIEAWMYGPVVPDVYYWYNTNFSKPIKGVKRNDIQFKESEIKVIRLVINSLINIDIWDIVAQTHLDKPWKLNVDGKSEMPIQDMKEWFSNNWGEIWSAYQKRK